MIDDLKKKASVKRISGDIKKYCLSGEGTHELIDLEQTMANVISYTEGVLKDAERAVQIFESKGGSVSVKKNSDSNEAVFTLNTISWTHTFDQDGRCIGCSPSIGDIEDADSLDKITAAMRAYYAIDKLQLTIEELNKILIYLENDNALRGMDNISEAVKANASLLVDMASSADTDDGDAAVDFTSILRGV